MQSKSLLIAIAAFAVTATGVQAYGNAKLLNRAELSEEQRMAIEEAQQLRAEGNVTAARDRLVEAGIDDLALRKLHHVAHELRVEMHDALENGDYKAFLEAIEGTPLADIITTAADFEQFKETHELKQSGEWAEAQAIFEELGIEQPIGDKGRGHHQFRMFAELSDEQREALRVAKEANNREAVHAILEEAGIQPHRSWR